MDSMSHRLATAPIFESDEDLPWIELTAAEKRKAMWASNLAREEEANKALEASTAGKTRLSKAKVLSDKVWDPNSTSSQPSNSRKHSLSSTQEPGKTKKAKGRNTTVPEQPAHVPEKTKTLPQSDHTGPTEYEVDGEDGEHQQPAQGRRHYAAPVILDDSESEDNIISAAPVKPILLSEPGTHTKQPKPLSDVDSGDNTGKSEDYDQASDDAVPSGDGGLGDDLAEVDRQLLLEHPRILHPQASPSDDVEMEEVSDHAPSFHHRRQSSSSSWPPSEYEVPSKTDFESGPDMVSDDDSADESDKEAPELPPPKPRKSAQQAKYDLEKPAVKLLAVPPKKTGGDKVKVKLEQQDTVIPTADITDQTKWGVSARIVFPHSQGDLRLNDQHSSLRAVIKLAIELAFIDIVFVQAYAGITSRGTFVRPYLLQAAQEFGYGNIKIRVKRICARIGLLRNAIKQLAVAKVPVYCQLTEGATPSEIRTHVKLILANQQYIFPITWRDRHTPTPIEGSAVPQPSMGKKGTTQEHMELFESTLDDLPDEHELPNSMPALVASHICRALHNWKTGHFQSTLTPSVRRVPPNSESIGDSPRRTVGAEPACIGSNTYPSDLGQQSMFSSLNIRRGLEQVFRSMDIWLLTKPPLGLRP
ncbi:hypothetical protein B0H17DRAFT_1137244 [Mycena rosella]|uniref:DUF6532 domain-containing protein n=1 Tax=Mycena rosella TaxID=1033263 RepID=A0AAD7D9D4_MYCRO|nr:hypothetical protein B0H17DRAFT_1137244 [Mycena rosella]